MKQVEAVKQANIYLTNLQILQHALKPRICRQVIISLSRRYRQESGVSRICSRRFLVFLYNESILIVEADTMNYGYIRVSAKDQNEARQLAATEKLDIPPGNLYIDKQSGKDFQRPAYRRMLRRLRRGDVCMF